MLRKGAILEYRRCYGLFYHYAMYIGDNKVIHRDKKNLFSYGHIYVTDLDKMVGTMKILPLQMPHVPTEQAIATALELTETDNSYNVLTNNCEHFVNYVRYHNRVSNQVQKIKQFIIIGLYALMVLKFNK